MSSTKSLPASCLCGAIKLNLDLPAQHKTICHCLDCRKISGSTHSYSLNFPSSALTISSGKESLKQYTKTTDHGSQLVNHFCSYCGTTLWREGGTMGENVVNIKAGIIDDTDWIDEHGKPEIEVYVERSPVWQIPVEGAVQLNERYEVVHAGDSALLQRLEDQRRSDDPMRSG